MKKLCFKTFVNSVNVQLDGWDCELNFLTGKKYFPRKISVSEAGKMLNEGYVLSRAEIEARNKRITRIKKDAAAYAKGLRTIFTFCMKPSAVEQMVASYMKVGPCDSQTRWRRILVNFSTDHQIH